ncbi:hypothetical protein [Bdellovibrio svalbardensis]|uniref:Lipoprotein n=1 Tax=Bdellovibrio svalbardensis TaxID=2972972 RepID=A0ABT6DJC7_9BACT|nr:hypothetical protein [Bdellovibrio svalbardensis]MDG0816970.1 hypothetical protein [Bdellovibrio svalbardensis]
MRSLFPRLLILALAAGSLSCMKQPEMDEKSTPASLAEVQNAMVDGWGQTSPLTMKVNDFVYTETDQRLEQQDAKLVLQEGITVSKKEETAKDVNYTYLYQVAVVTGDQAQQSTREDHRCVAKTDDGCPETAAAPPTPDAAVPAALKNLVNLQEKAKVQAAGGVIKPFAEDYQMSLGFEKFLSLAYACQKTTAVDTYCKQQMKVDSCDIKCTNLKSVTELIDAPAGIKQQPNCGGFKDCKINLKRVSFDWSFVTKTGTETHTQKINYSIALSPDMPFLARMMEYCSRGLLDIGTTGNKVLVTVCNRTKNYKAAP